MHHDKQHVRPSGNGRRRAHPPEKLVCDILRTRFAEQAGPQVIAVGGPGGTGKTTFAQALARQLGEDTAVLALDDYKTAREERRRSGIFGAHPEANKMDLIAAHLDALRRGERIRKPVYDPATGDAHAAEAFTPRRWTIIEGEISTYRRFRDRVDFAVFIDSDWRTQLATRLGRDLEQRSYSPEKAVATFLHSNLREFAEHGAESKSWADIHLFCRPDYRLELESLDSALYAQVRSVLESEVSEVDWDGLIVPMLTPFSADGALAPRAFVEHLAWLASHGVTRVLVGGTTGEFFSLSTAERIELLELALEYFPGLVLFHVGGGSLPDTLELARRAQELGADGILCLPPAYFAQAPTEGLVQYLQAVAEVVDAPLLLCNFPRHTQNPLTPDILRRVPHFGLKDSSGDLSLIPETPRYFLGDDKQLADGIQAGATGFVSAAANAFPEPYVQLENAARDQCRADGVAQQNSILELLEGLESPLIAGLKAALQNRVPDYPLSTRPPLC